MRPRLLIACSIVCGVGAFGAIAGFSRREPVQKPVRYSRDIRPLLSDRCFTCHGPDAAARKAELRLDLAEEAGKAHDGVIPIIPGDAEGSEVWKRITSHDEDEAMPPVKAGRKPLTETERGLIKRWIDEGAKYEAHWAFVPPVRPSVPEGESGAIDAFIAEDLRAKGLAMSVEAPREVLARRVFLDLTGLPPTPEEVDAFTRDESGDAYERLVDRLLTQEPYKTRYAERMATPWLDQARYADTSGIHTDAGRSIWPWRDWVLRAYRDNMPFDQFIREQLAGDLLPDATVQQKIATGFHRNHVTSDEGGAINEEYLVEYAVDRVNTTGSVLLGLTVGCARCHDHKYDPITMDDFYGMFAFFNSIEEPGIYSQLPDDKRAFEPFLDVPSDEQVAKLAELDRAIGEADAALNAPNPAETGLRNAFVAQQREYAEASWTVPTIVSAETSGGSTISPQADGSALITGKNPDSDMYTLKLSTNATNLRMLMLEVLTDPSTPDDRPGRSGNGNAMLTGLECTVAPADNSAPPVAVKFNWAWADIEQQNGDYGVATLLHPGPDRGWALNGHFVRGRRTAVLMSDAPFGAQGGSTLEVRLKFESPYARHGMGRVRVRVSPLSTRGIELAPMAIGSWHTVGPFPADRGAVYAQVFGPEEKGGFDFEKTFQPGNRRWAFDGSLVEGAVKSLSDGVNAFYLARRVYSPTARELTMSLGSDDGLRIFVNGRDAYGNNIERGAVPDQDRVTIKLDQGVNDVVFKVVNTGGAAGFAHRLVASEGEIPHDLFAAILPEDSLSTAMQERTAKSWRMTHSEEARALVETREKLGSERAMVVAAIPRTMVMAELPKPRETFVLKRGQYDHPDKERPAHRSVPRALGKLPQGSTEDRRGLSEWIMSAENPLTARVVVNRLWAQFFGTGIVTTGDDFGLQGQFPTHPELLDWLAVEYRESGWNTREMVRRIVLSKTYRQSAVITAGAKQVDPSNSLLAYFPRQRMSAEQIRDVSLGVSGLLVEKFGGPSVKPLQPSGLWEEVAMPASNTKAYAPGKGDDLHRRSLYTYWKRASPPPTMQIFDAPTRESCVTQRTSTNTPLQALVLWNDPQFVEAARALAVRMLKAEGDDAARLSLMYKTCTGETADGARMGVLARTLGSFRARYSGAPEDAAKLLGSGGAMVPEGVERPELAAWTMVVSSVMATDAFVTKD